MEPITNREIEEKYSLATTICLQNNYNKCEKNELLLLIEIFYLNQTKQYDKLVTIFGEQASQGIEINCKNNNKIITDITRLPKFKANCMVRMIKYNYEYDMTIIYKKNPRNPGIKTVYTSYC